MSYNLNSLGRVIKFAFQDIFRNAGLSAMTVLVLVLMLLSVNSLWSLQVLTRESISLVKSQVTLSLYLNSAADLDAENALIKYLRALNSVVDVRAVSSEQVYQEFKARHQLRPEILDALNELGGNPFGPTILVKAREPGDYKNIMAAVSGPEFAPFIEAKSFEEHEDALSRIQTITDRVERVGLIITILFAIIAFLIIFNAIRVAIAGQHQEISIKRLVGASNWLIRGPYLVEALLFSLVSMLITIILVYVGLKQLDPYLSIIFPNGFALTKYYNSHIVESFGVQTLAVVLLTFSSSLFAMRRQLKV